MRDHFQLGSKLLGLWFTASGLMMLVVLALLMITVFPFWSGDAAMSGMELAVQKARNDVGLRLTFFTLGAGIASVALGCWLMRSHNLFVRYAYGDGRGTAATPAPARAQSSPAPAPADDEYRPPRL
ncbi:MAG: hypothetical protein ACOCXJ_01260 [Planctomycetota bacterium]